MPKIVATGAGDRRTGETGSQTGRMPTRGHRAAASVLVALVALIASSCGSASKGRVGQAPGPTTVPSTAAPGPSGPAPSAPSPSMAGGRHAPGSGTASGGPRPGQANTNPTSPAATPAPQGPGTAAPDRAVTAAAGGPPGAFAPVLLQPRSAARIAVEVLAQSGAAPRSSTVQHLTDVLRTASGGKDISSRQGSVPGGARSWGQGELGSAADQNTTVPQGAGGTAVIHLLYLHGDYGGDQSVLGVAVRGDVLAVFVDQLQASASVAVPERTLEDAVTVHETGHLLGLVDLVLHTGRQDPDHPGHSTNRGSVMYWAVDTDLVSQLLDGGPATDFDDADRRDLATIRAGG